MKKVTLIIASLAVLAFSSCKEEQKEEPTTVVVEQPAAETQATEESDGTSISVNSDGVEFSTKDGDNKTEVEVNDGSGTVKVEK
ncbi:hypothetical protein [uncultured Flavobacterium sp.]|uniref:hypothetical protein n=1 Tax=uncultured Flavobacterium sp. TaxID=165435 RepID=UPI0030EDED3E|tara:strand:+ start:928 stop:1179 length:252 start_codon:yes stop_codon:yes gene_type:complete